MIHIYYGCGKGKTTAALGAGMRAFGAGMSVALVQLLKDNKSSEISAVPFKVFNAPDCVKFNPGEEYMPCVKNACEFIKNVDADVIILDEFLDAIPDYISEETALDLLNRNAEYIITGHKRVDSIFSRADYITFMKKEKHPYDKGVCARLGIEY